MSGILVDRLEFQ